jgi:glucan phosphoethanolaminetransferase (alkaline phosphatase superfamily)
MDWLRRMLMGRYGVDQLTIAMLAFYVVLSLVSQIARLPVLSLLSLVLLGLCFFRMLSRNTQKRYRENVRFLEIWNPVKQWFFNLKYRIQDRKTHRYFKCPRCSSTLRVPRGRGKISITCPVCKNEFIRKA